MGAFPHPMSATTASKAPKRRRVEPIPWTALYSMATKQVARLLGAAHETKRVRH